jgi:hypothetical protein
MPPALLLMTLIGCSRPAVVQPIPASPTIALRHADGDLFEVNGLDPSALAQLSMASTPRSAWTALFTVIANDNLEPMLGAYSVEFGLLRFRPRWPLVPGIRYTATVHPDKQPGGPRQGALVRANFTVDPPPLPPPATVAMIYPSANRLPENLLRIYLQFTGPMRRGGVYDFVQLLGPDGKPVVTPFVTFGEELWNPDGTRLTLLLDPGRQKHDLLPREQTGPVLEAGKQYTLVLKPDWPDAHGRSLGRNITKQFTAVAAESRAVQPGDWKLTPPPAGSQKPLSVSFDRALDQALLARMVTVADAAGKMIDGESTTADGETHWQFVPRQPWAAGTYSLVIDPALEDVCGNRVGRAFEVDEDRTPPGPATMVRRVFPIK